MKASERLQTPRPRSSREGQLTSVAEADLRLPWVASVSGFHWNESREIPESFLVARGVCLPAHRERSTDIRTMVRCPNAGIV
jgi:hypothetical protein